MRWILVTLFFATLAQAAPPATEKELLQRFQQALAAKDLKAMADLYHWQDVSHDMRTKTAMVLDELTRKEIKNVVLGRWSQKKEAVVKGVRFRPNLTPAGAIVVTYAADRATEKLEIPFGKVSGGFSLSAITEEALPSKKARPRSFAVSVGGTASPTPAKFTGFYIAVVDGKEIRKEFNGQAGLVRQFRGDAVKYCEVRKTTPTGSIYLLITADGQTLFESPKTATGEPITYAGR